MNKLFKITNRETNESTFLTCVAKNADKLEEMLRSDDYCGKTHEIKVFEAGKMPFNELPNDIQAKAKEILKAFDEVNVEYSNREFHVSTAYVILASYPYDKFTCGYYKQEEIYTKEERRQNFKEEFGYIPFWLK